MRRLVAIAAFLVLAASVQLQAQRGGGGGHASGGGHGGFSSHGSFGGGFSGGHSFGGARAGFAGASRSFSRGSSFRGRVSSRGFNSRGFDRFGNRLRFRSYGYRNNCYAYGCGYPYLYGGIDPYWWWDNDSSYDQDQQDQVGLANEMNQQSLDEQQMRRQGDQDAYARSAPRPPLQANSTESDPATVLIFRDQHKEEIKNYAIVGQTLWNFSPHRTQKIPLSELDLAATEKANDDRGVEFHVPGAGEGQ